LDKPLHVIYKVSKLAYRISVILIANERVKKKVSIAIQAFDQTLQQLDDPLVTEVGRQSI
jgi:hypothetical protein